MSVIFQWEPANMAWNEERVEMLRKLWLDGLSASQIAARLGGGVSRNAVIGKVHRLGLSGRATTSRMKSLRPKVARTPAHSALPKRPGAAKPNFGTLVVQQARRQPDLAIEPYVPTADELVIPLAERRSIQTLSECSCRWPIGDPQLADFHFCGKDKVPGLPYCEFHAGRAFQPPQPRRRDREPALPIVRALTVASGR
jgi:GcrA cell cycle regulator